jgi:exosome complex exonuclease DIS3/RRP44
MKLTGTLKMSSKKKVEPFCLVRASGNVVGIIRQRWHQFLRILQATQLKGTQIHIFAPADRKVSRIRIETRRGVTLQMQRIIVTIYC